MAATRSPSGMRPMVSSICICSAAAGIYGLYRDLETHTGHWTQATGHH
jgi:hypothetical protein